MFLWKKVTDLLVTRFLRLAVGAKILINSGTSTEAEIDLAELAALNNIAAADLQKIDGITNGTPVVSKALVLDSALGIGAFRETGRNLRKQAAPAAKTTSTTLTAAEIMAGLLTGQQGGAAAAVYTMPLGADLEVALIAAFPGLANDDSFDFSIINISTVGAETITLAVNTGVTLVGDLSLACIATGDESAGTFRVRRTAADTYVGYRLT